MIYLFAAALAMQPASSDPAVELCKPVLARKAGGEIATIAVSSSFAAGRRRTIEGQLSVFAKMGPAPAGFARTHHLGRIELAYRCEISGGRVRRARVSPVGQ